jgi:gentisate 1,2-dioxygenase
VEASLKAGLGPHRIHYYQSNGKHLSNTLSAQAEMVEAGHTTAVAQETCSFIYHIYEGEGRTIVKTPSGQESTIDWIAKDTFTVPAWSEVQHINKGSTAAYLFAINDRPLIESLGLGRRAGQKPDV